jgi:predicted HicB family RNase H-like nuclease
VNILRYRGYEAKFEFDPDAKIFHGRVLGTRDVITFQSEDPAMVEQEFHTSIDGYLTFCNERGEAPDKPYSGHIRFRTEPKLHRKIAYAVAQESDLSLSQWIERACEHELERIADASLAVPSPMLDQPQVLPQTGEMSMAG